MKLKNSQDLFSLAHGDVVTKRNLYDLIQYSKVEASPYWSGPESIIGNTPQQGINWIGHTPELQAVIIKTRPGAYKADGWSDIEKTLYRYSFKARSGAISYGEMANEVLIKQPQHLYPILLFTEHKDGWYFEGDFSVAEIESEFVTLHRGASPSEIQSPQDELVYHEGTRKYVTHLMAERSKGVVKALKSVNEWVCDICNDDFLSRYGVKYIEAHHTIPTSTYSSRYVIRLSDLALLCPNCHRAVHIYMKSTGLDYIEIKNKLRTISQDSRPSASGIGVRQ